MYKLSRHVSTVYGHYQMLHHRPTRKSTFTMRYMLNRTLIFDDLQYDVNQTLVNKIKYNYNRLHMMCNLHYTSIY
jgi:hypothetical protein